MSSARIGIAPISPLRFGRYTLVASLGAGGMADVYLAIATGMAGFRKLVVVKRLRGEILEDESYHRMLLDEARLAARLNHPNVVQTYEVAVQGDESYLAMEHLHGQSLLAILHGRRLRREPLSDKIITHVMAELLEGLAYAHELEDFDGTPLGVVHRDVSPGNVMVTYDGVVKLLDFGLAKATTQWEDTDPDHRKGKFAYIAPEQVEGNPDARSDLFSLGVVFWEALANRRLFAAKDPMETLKRAMAASVPPIERELPDGLEDVVRKALAKSPRERYQSARAMRLALERVIRLNKLAMRRIELSRFMKEEFEGLREKHGVALRSAVEAGLESGSDSVAVLDGEPELGTSPGTQFETPESPPSEKPTVESPARPASSSPAAAPSPARRGKTPLALGFAAAGVGVVAIVLVSVVLVLALGDSSDDVAETPPDEVATAPESVRVVDDVEPTQQVEPVAVVEDVADAPDAAAAVGQPDAGRDPLDWGEAELEAFERHREEAREHFAAELFAEAALSYREAIRMNPAHSGSFAGLAASEMAAGNLDAAVRAYQEAVRLEPTRSGFHAALARAYREVGSLELSLESYEQALRLDRQNGAARDGRSEVRRELRRQRRRERREQREQED